jgi:hypothetical protein
MACGNLPYNILQPTKPSSLRYRRMQKHQTIEIHSFVFHDSFILDIRLLRFQKTRQLSMRSMKSTKSKYMVRTGITTNSLAGQQDWPKEEILQIKGGILSNR